MADDPLAVNIPSLDEPGLKHGSYGRTGARNGHDGRSSPPVATAADAPAPTRGRATYGYNVLLWRGRLAADPVVQTSGSGSKYLRIRCLQSQPDRNGQAGTHGIEIPLFGERAVHFGEFFRKGDEILVKGRLAIETTHDRHGVVRVTASIYPDGPIELLHRPGQAAPLHGPQATVGSLRDLLARTLGESRAAAIVQDVLRALPVPSGNGHAHP